jgi:hypothetical protein
MRMYERAIATLSARDKSRSQTGLEPGGTICADFGRVPQSSSIAVFKRTRDCLALSLCISRRAEAKARPLGALPALEARAARIALLGRPGLRRGGSELMDDGGGEGDD